jgi:uncharacterized membrane protein
MLKTLLVAMTPVLEIRGAIPVGLAAGLSPWTAYFVSVVGNMLPIPILILLTRRVLLWLKKYPSFRSFAEKLEAKAHKNSEKVLKYEFWGLLILVAIPLPGTGAWTGALVASVMDLRLRSSLPAIGLGVAAAGLIVLAVSCGVMAVF